jgi:ClpP class serine protease
MPNFREVVNEAVALGNQFDVVRRKYIRQLAELTGRNVIVYYSAFLQKPNPEFQLHLQVSDSDKNGFMATVHQMDRTKGLDLFLHTPGGDAAATESLVHYLREMFGTDIRAVVPQIAMSAGTMIALSCKEILMGKHSNLGPIDPSSEEFQPMG